MVVAVGACRRHCHLPVGAGMQVCRSPLHSTAPLPSLKHLRGPPARSLAASICSPTGCTSCCSSESDGFCSSAAAAAVGKEQAVVERRR